MTKKLAGILLPITSLPSEYGVGCFSQSAYDFVDQLKAAGQSLWQILPIHPTSYGDSPYQSFSTFAGNPYFISLEALVEEGVLTQEECEAADWGSDPSRVDYEKLYHNRYPLLRKAYERSNVYQDETYQQFIAENGWWLNDYALFMALKNYFGGKSWSEWPEDIRLRWKNALDYYRRELYFDVEFQLYIQFKFFQQYKKLRAYANKQGIRIVGDIPIYVSMDSADTWANPQLFQLDEENKPIAVAGCPPDGFSATGQMWGNPLYRWDYHQQTDFSWWISRLWQSFELYDVVRVDHFRGFDEYFSIPFAAESALEGHWEKGPGLALFERMRHHLGERSVIAEDLGYMTQTVRDLVRDTGFPNMKVLQFAFDEGDLGAANDYLPHNYAMNCVAYTGTHDNETIQGWFDGLDEKGKKRVRDYLCDQHTPDAQMYKKLVATVMVSCADTCIIPIQDYIGLDNECRMNKPSTVGMNWRWRLKDGQITPMLEREMLKTTMRYGRVNWDALKAD